MLPYLDCYLYKHIQNEYENFALHNVEVTPIDKIL